MKKLKLLLASSLLPAAERLCKELSLELNVVDPAPVWSRQTRRLTQIDCPEPTARLMEETASVRGVAPEVLLHSWIEQYKEEVEGKGAGEQHLLPRTSMEEKLRMIRQWAEPGYAGREDAIRDLARQLARE